MDDKGQVLGRGITNSRSNYDTAARVSKLEAFIDARLSLIRRELDKVPALPVRSTDPRRPDAQLPREQFIEQRPATSSRPASANVKARVSPAGKVITAADRVFRRLRKADAVRAGARNPTSSRDIAGSPSRIGERGPAMQDSPDAALFDRRSSRSRTVRLRATRTGSAPRWRCGRCPPPRAPPRSARRSMRRSMSTWSSAASSAPATAASACPSREHIRSRSSATAWAPT